MKITDYNRAGRVRYLEPQRREELSTVFGKLIDADDRGDATALARLGWALFIMAGTAQQAQRETADLVHDLLTAARAATAGDGSPASLAPLRHVLARHGCLPPRGTTPLQVLADAG
jgi:hypothetical protein